MKQRIIVETVDKDDDNHIDKRVGCFFGDDAYFDTVRGIREVNSEPIWEILFDDKDVYDYNLS